MRVRDLLGDLREKGVRFELDGLALIVDAPTGVVDEETRYRLAEAKPEIVKLLAREQQRLREAGEMCMVIEWSGERGWISVHDPTTGEWHDLKAEECPPWMIEAAGPRPRETREANR